MKPTRTIDGSRFSDISGFYDEVERVLIPGAPPLLPSGASWGRNLDAFNDILRGGFGTPTEDWTLRWVRSDLSQSRLGELYTKLLEIIRYHGPGRSNNEAVGEITLELEIEVIPQP